MILDGAEINIEKSKTYTINDLSELMQISCENLKKCTDISYVNTFKGFCKNKEIIENTKKFIRIVIMDITDSSNVYKLLLNNKQEIISYWYMIKEYYRLQKIDKKIKPEEKICN
jgi:hypothetical protein